MSARVSMMSICLIAAFIPGSMRATASVPASPLTTDTIIDPEWQRTDTFRVDSKRGDYILTQKGCSDADDPYWTWTPFDNSVVWNGPEHCYFDPMPPGAPMPADAWFKWYCQGNYTHYWFRAYFEIGDVSHVASIVLIDEYARRPSNGAQAIAINDNMYTCVNGKYDKHGGSAFPESNWEYTTNPANRWERGCQVGIMMDPLSVDLGLLVNGQNEIAVLGEDVSDRGGLGHLVLKVTWLNSAPVCDAGGPYRAECANPGGTEVTLDGTGSYDPDGDSLRFQWHALGVVFDDPTSPTPTGRFPQGITAVSVTVSDGDLSDSCETTVEVNDTQPPSITCPPDLTQEADAYCQVIYTGPVATATDNCDASPSINSIPPLPATFSGVGTYTISWIATDASGNADTCYQTIAVVDKTRPKIACPPNVALEANDNCQATYTGPGAAAADNCDAMPRIRSVPPLPATFTGVGMHTIMWTATDASGNADTCYQTITVVDKMKPEITCPPNVTLEADGNCQVTYSGPYATAFDNCDPDPKVTGVPVLPATFTGVGTYTLMWMATDVSGNADTCYQTVKVIDVTPPVVACPRDAVLKADVNCQVVYSGPPATATDNCDASPKIASAPSVPATFTGVGTYTITWTATDAWGNRSSCDQRITVIDVVPPTITCPYDAVLPGDLNCEVVYAGPFASAIDNCDASPKITSVPPLPATFKGVGNHTIVYTATDFSGNSSECTQTVTIIDVLPPVITCPPDTAMAASGLDCSVTYSGPSATAFDNCDGNPTVTSVPALPATFNTIGKHDIVFTATDFSGNTSVCKMTVTVSMTSYCLKNETIPALQALLPTGKKKIDEKIDKAIEHLWHSLNVDPKHPGKPWKKEALWLDATHLDPKHGEPVFEEEEKVAKYLAEAMKEKDCPPDIEDDLMAAITSVVSCDQMLARIQIDDAKKAGGDPKEIAKAEKEMAKGKEEEEGEEYEKAVEHYENAWLHAIKAMPKEKGMLAGGQSAAEVASPCAFALSQNSPNPFTRETTISFTLPVPGYTTLRVYDVTGREVAMLVDEDMEAGVYTVKWNRDCCSSGIYFYRLESGNRSLTKKMTVIR